MAKKKGTTKASINDFLDGLEPFGPRTGDGYAGLDLCDHLVLASRSPFSPARERVGYEYIRENTSKALPEYVFKHYRARYLEQILVPLNVEDAEIESAMDVMASLETKALVGKAFEKELQKDADAAWKKLTVPERREVLVLANLSNSSAQHSLPPTTDTLTELLVAEYVRHYEQFWAP